MTGPAADETQRKSVVEAVLHGRGAPVSESELAAMFPGWPIRTLLGELDDDYKGRGVTLARAAGGWCLRSSPEASDLANRFSAEPVRLSRAAMEVLAVVAAFQSSDPVTRSDIERVRGVQLSPTIFAALLEAGFIRPGRRRETPGRPLTWATTDRFLEHFDVEDVASLQAVVNMRETGLLVLPTVRPEGEAQPDGAAGL